jgi:hypothetical protein
MSIQYFPRNQSWNDQFQNIIIWESKVYDATWDMDQMIQFREL